MKNCREVADVVISIHKRPYIIVLAAFYGTLLGTINRAEDQRILPSRYRKNFNLGSSRVYEVMFHRNKVFLLEFLDPKLPIVKYFSDSVGFSS